MIVTFRFLDNGCWEWHGPLHRGYGQASRNGVSVRAHRAMYEQLTGVSIPEQMTVDHICRNRACVNPDHMELVDASTNAARGRAAREAEEWPCGHPRTDENTYRTGTRERCRCCYRQYHREYMRARKASA